MKQSSIEWLMEQITYDNGFGQRLNSYIDGVDLSAYFEQAKAMHKEEIMNAHTHGRNVERGIDDGIFTSEEYYN